MKVTIGARRLAAVGAALAMGAGLLTACGGGSSSSGSPKAGPSSSAPAGPKQGGSLTILETNNFAGNWPTGLGTTTNATALAVQSMMNAIYGQLFELGPDGKTHPDLASGWQLSPDATKLTINIRKGVTFTDGTPFDAAAVAQNFKDDMAAKGTAGAGVPAIPVASIDTPDDHTVVLNLSKPDGAVVNQFQDSLFNWIASPTAEQKLGLHQFAITPVAAGPFMVVSNTLNSKLVLKRNPNYWEKGKPYLDNLTFQATASDQTALGALQAGTAQAYEFMRTPRLLSAYKSAGLQVTEDKGNGTLDVQINTEIAPFTNIKAREAIYYATDSQTISDKVYEGTCPLSQSFTGPSGLFYEPKVPGYRTYDLAKAKALVKELGGLSFTLTAESVGVQLTEAEALQTMYQQAGMNVTLKTVADLASLIQEYNSHKWQIIPASIGAWDPADAIGVAFRMKSDATFTGIKDPKVDQLIDQGQAGATTQARAKAYADLAKYVSDQAYTPFMCSATTWDIAAKGVSGPGLTTAIPGGDVGPQILWEDVSVGNA